ncbi:hypothetical protein GIB67_013599, partial [Kingdonia uniflora]
KFVDYLALLPKTKGDEGSWSLMMQKTLITINNHLTVTFQGLEEEGKDREVLKLLVPPRKDASSPLGGEDASHKAENRVLLVDGSLSSNIIPFIAVMQKEFICLDLPILHLQGLDLLIAAIKGIRSQLLPHAAGVVRLLKEYFKKYELLALRDGVLATMRSSIIDFPSYFNCKIIIYYVMIFMYLLQLKDELLGQAEEPGEDPIYKNQSLDMDVLYRVGKTQQVITYLLFQHQSPMLPMNMISLPVPHILFALIPGSLLMARVTDMLIF